MKERESLEDDFLKNEVQLSDQLSKQSDSRKQPKEYEQNRILFFYELCREMCYYWIGPTPLSISSVQELYSKQEFSNMELWVFLQVIHDRLADEPYKFKPWRCLTKKAKADFVSEYAEQAKTYSRMSPQYPRHNLTMELAASFEHQDSMIKLFSSDEISNSHKKYVMDEMTSALNADPNKVAESLKKGELPEEFKITGLDQMENAKLGLHPHNTALERFVLLFKQSLSEGGPEGWLIARFDPNDRENWDRQFEIWKKEHDEMFPPKKQKLQMIKNEPIDDWLDQISRVRILRKVGWDPNRASGLNRIRHLKPSKPSLWNHSIKAVNEHFIKFFYMDTSKYGELLRPINRESIKDC